MIKGGELKYTNKTIRGDYYDITVHICDINDIIRLYYDGRFIPKRKAEDIPDITDDNIAMALYLINKSAKKSRDTKKENYSFRNFTVCKSAKTREQNLYALKNDVMRKLITDGKMLYQGIDTQLSERGETTYLKSYSFAGYVFHSIAVSGTFDEEELSGKTISGVISSDKTREVTISFNQAKEMLKQYAYGQSA